MEKSHLVEADTARHQPAAALSTSSREPSEAALQLNQLQALVDRSPRMLAQRRSLDAAFGGGVHPSPTGGLEDEKPLQGRFAFEAAASVRLHEGAAAPVNLTGMPNQLKAGIESVSGMNLDDVRVHRNSDKPAQLNALAYAQGNDIHLGPGQEQHLRHEAWHVVQQRQGRVKETIQMAGLAVNDEVGLEREADLMGGLAFSQGAGMHEAAKSQDGPRNAPLADGALDPRNHPPQLQFAGVGDAFVPRPASGARSTAEVASLKPAARRPETPPLLSPGTSEGPGIAAQRRVSQMVGQSPRLASQRLLNENIACSQRRVVQLQHLAGAQGGRRGDHAITSAHPPALVVQRVQHIRTGRKVKVNLEGVSAAGASITFHFSGSESATVESAPDADSYVVRLNAYKYRNETEAVTLRRVDQALVSPSERKEYETDRSEDQGRALRDADAAIEALVGWNPDWLTLLSKGESLRLVMKGIGADPALFAQVMLRIYETPKMQPLLAELGRIKSTALHPGGRTDHTLTALAELQMTMLGKLGYEPGRGMAKLTEATILARGKSAAAVNVPVSNAAPVQAGLPMLGLGDVCPDFEARDWEILGRTVIFHPSQIDKRFMAVKLAKKGEDLDELYKEGGMQSILDMAKKLALDEDSSALEEDARSLGLDPVELKKMRLSSTFPQPVGVFMLNMPSAYSEAANRGVSRGIEDQFAQGDGEQRFPCFVYCTNDYQYFQYINRARDERRTTRGSVEERGLGLDDMRAGNNAGMHDIFATAGQSWMFTQLIDLYHHNSLAEAKNDVDQLTNLLRTGDDRVADGGGRFIVLLDLLRKVGQDRGSIDPSMLAKTWGMGRVDNVTGAVGYPNVRKTGVADLGDARSLDELLTKVKELQRWYARFKTADRPAPLWREVLSATSANTARDDARSIGFLKPDLELAKDVAAALRRYDQAVLRAVQEQVIPGKNETGFFDTEVKKALIGTAPNWTSNADDLLRGREVMKLNLIESCGLNQHPDAGHRALVDHAYDALHVSASDGQPASETELLWRDKAMLGREVLEKTESGAPHRKQAEQHANFNDVKHLLVPAAQDGAVTPYVMTAYLSEFFISHLLLTGTYFCQDVTTAERLKAELSLGASASSAECPNLEELKHTLLSGCAAAVIGFCGLPATKEGAIMIMLEGFADFPKLARQVAFFMTDKYADVILNSGTFEQEDLPTLTADQVQREDNASWEEMLRLGVFDKTDHVELDNIEKDMRNKYRNRSWGRDDQRGTGRDLGTYNGQMPIKEFEVLAYRIVPYLMFKQHALRQG